MSLRLHLNLHRKHGHDAEPYTQPIVVQNLAYVYGKGEVATQVLKNIDLEVGKGEIVILTGPSGSGKTTLLTIIGALRAAQTGVCTVLGQDLHGASEHDRVRLRRQIGFIFQQHNLLGYLTANQNVAMSLELKSGTSEKDRLEIAHEMLGHVGLADRADRLPEQLSGGQKLRVAIARALVNNPPLILADEPTAALDRQSGQDVTAMLHTIAKTRGTTILLVTHDPRILGIADRIVNMEDGHIAMGAHGT